MGQDVIQTAWAHHFQLDLSCMAVLYYIKLLTLECSLTTMDNYPHLMGVGLGEG